MERTYVKDETYNDEVTNRLTDHYQDVLKQLGENPEREGLLKTPERVAKAMQFLTHGYGLNPDDLINEAIFNEEYSEMVIVKDIEVYSMCEHHMLPFFGKAHIAYIPDGKIVGLSKIPRVVDAYSRRLQVQERLTNQIGRELVEILGTEDVAVIIDAKHLCVSSRGIKDDTSSTVTAYYGGAFNTSEKIVELQNYLKA